MSESEPKWGTRRCGLPVLLAVCLALLALLLCCCVKILRFEMPDSTVKTVLALSGRETRTPQPPEYEGYVFLGWQSQDGDLTGDTLIARSGGVFSPVYTVALTGEHVQYLFPDEYGFYHPYDVMTRGDAARMLYALLAVKPESAGNYADVAADADCAEATAALYHLQVTDGVCYYPDEPLRLGELLTMLARFFPKGHESFDIADVASQNAGYAAYCLALEKGWVELDADGRLDPGRTVSRLEVCRLMNRALDRPGSSELKSFTGLIPDMEPGAEGFGEMVEAALTHEYELADGMEIYGSYPAFKRLPEGFIQVGSSLYYVEKDGTVLTDGAKDKLYFGDDGRYTSGDEKLDELVDAVLDRVLDPSMDAMERLRAVYDYTVVSFDYQPRDILKRGATGWEAEQAYLMFSTGNGNCYSYAAAFCMLARAVGFDAYAMAGTADFMDNAHGWVEIELDGVGYLFDPEREMTNLFNSGVKLDCFMFTRDEANGWNYDSSER